MLGAAILSTIGSSGISVPQYPVNTYNSASQAFEVPGRNGVALFFLFERVIGLSRVEDLVASVLEPLSGRFVD